MVMARFCTLTVAVVTRSACGVKLHRTPHTYIYMDECMRSVVYLTVLYPPQFPGFDIVLESYRMSLLGEAGFQGP